MINGLIKYIFLEIILEAYNFEWKTEQQNENELVSFKYCCKTWSYYPELYPLFNNFLFM